MGGSNFFASPEPSPPRVRAASVRPSEDGDEANGARQGRDAPGAAVVRRSATGRPSVCNYATDRSFRPPPSPAAMGRARRNAPTRRPRFIRCRQNVSRTPSPHGVAYTKLPVAKRFQSTFDNTCTCHRDSVASVAKELLHDSTLRKGDVVMTPSGFRVYEGEGYVPSSPKDFVALSKAAGVPKESRATLAAMEQARVGGSPPPSAPPSVAAARSKGNVTVDDGDAPPAQ